MKYKCEWCGKKVTADKAYQITRYDQAWRTDVKIFPVQIICEECIKTIGHRDETSE